MRALSVAGALVGRGCVCLLLLHAGDVASAAVLSLPDTRPCYANTNDLLVILYVLGFVYFPSKVYDNINVCDVCHNWY